MKMYGNTHANGLLFSADGPSGGANEREEEREEEREDGEEMNEGAARDGRYRTVPANINSLTGDTVGLRHSFCLSIRE